MEKRRRRRRKPARVAREQYGLTVEIDGIQHTNAPAVIADALRQNDLTNGRSVVLRLPVLGLRSEPTRFLAQVRNALPSLGWQPPGAASVEA
ncbi:hypothetical protein [Kribbella sp. VKM Ac-2568]|uniref:hypothetical protein n=1 Tax=Kribbella sp. VKM Ac-2568 TaxID=2512219 RepID=UPI001046EB5C|nr:hypothetical protein [Kribbella sp. VKM Ac-2568]